MRLTLQEICAALGLAIPGQDCESTSVCSVVTDSRKVMPGALFVCIAGARTDGHTHAGAAVTAGAVAVLASRPLPGVDAPVLVVPDTVKALGQVGALWRSRTQARVTGITGTAGKTTLKEVLATILAGAGKTARNALNLNNQIGLPSSILATDGDERFWVMEAGISQEGDMDALGEILRPDLGIILNVGPGHTQGLGEKGVAWHKARLLAHLAKGGTGLVSADYPQLRREAAYHDVSLRYFSCSDPDVEFYGRWLGNRDGLGRYVLRLAGQEFEVTAPFGGAYGAENCIAAAAAAHLLGLDPEVIAHGLAVARLPQQRFARLRLGSWDVIDDSYNANPLSMQRMLEAAATQARGRKLVAVLGEMGELGKDSDRLHEGLGHLLARLSPAAIFWAGGQAEAVAGGLKAAGYGGLWLPVEDPQAFTARWQEIMGDGDGVVLFKGSRSNGLETYLEELRTVLTHSPEGTD